MSFVSFIILPTHYYMFSIVLIFVEQTGLFSIIPVKTVCMTKFLSI
jgi:hypothetical protein